MPRLVNGVGFFLKPENQVTKGFKVLETLTKSL